VTFPLLKESFEVGGEYTLVAFVWVKQIKKMILYFKD